MSEQLTSQGILTSASNTKYGFKCEVAINGQPYMFWSTKLTDQTEAPVNLVGHEVLVDFVVGDKNKNLINSILPVHNIGGPTPPPQQQQTNTPPPPQQRER